MDFKVGQDVAVAPSKTSKGVYVEEVVVAALGGDGASFSCHCWTEDVDKVTVEHGMSPMHPHIQVSFLFSSIKAEIS